MTHRGKKIKESGINYLKLRFAFMTSGCMFPETISQVKQYEKLFGSTSVLLPEKLQEPSFLYKDNKTNLNQSPKTNNEYLNYAIAAREGGIEIPFEIMEKMKFDRLTAEKKAKRNK